MLLLKRDSLFSLFRALKCPALLSSLLLLSSCAQLPTYFYDLENQQQIATESLIDRLGDKRIIFIGEAHDSEIDHKVQLEVIRQLNESGREVIIALEALPAQQNSVLKSWRYGHISESSLIKSYYLNWTVPYPFYAEIFRYAQSERLQLIGLNMTRKKIRALVSQGIDSETINKQDAIKFTSCEQEPKYARFMQSYWGELGHKIAFSRLCDMQRFKDAFMAYQITKALQQPESTVVVLVGSLHALKNGIPAIMQRHDWNSYLVMTTARLSELTQAPLTKQQSDLVWP
jgi:uncharacterized iron-regulated protein